MNQLIQEYQNADLEIHETGLLWVIYRQLKERLYTVTHRHHPLYFKYF